jgi:hypothetical protein
MATAGTVSFPFNFTVDSSANGGDIMDVVISNPSVVISVIRPDGVEVTVANAGSLGCTYATAANGSFSIAPLGFFSQSGAHVVITLSAGQPSGTYQVKADATALSSDTLVTGTYFSSSNVQVGLATQPQYTVGNTVVLTGFAVDGITPIQRTLE